MLLHIYLHARMVRRYAATDREAPAAKPVEMSKAKMLALLDSLDRLVRSFRYQPAGTEWAEYYQATSYSEAAFAEKQDCVRRMASAIQPKLTWDLGANTGVFSQIASEVSDVTVAWDIDPACIEKGYRALRERRATDIHPLVLDLTNPTGRLGWAGAERMSLADRGPADLVMALALIHHLAIANNVPLSDVASLMAQLGRHLIIEFVPKSDPQVQRLLTAREDIFPHYTQRDFERAFERHFVIEDQQVVNTSQASGGDHVDGQEANRVIYRMSRS